MHYKCLTGHKTLLDFETTRIRNVLDRRLFFDSHFDFLRRVLDSERATRQRFSKASFGIIKLCANQKLYDRQYQRPRGSHLCLSDCAAIIAEIAGVARTSGYIEAVRNKDRRLFDSTRFGKRPLKPALAHTRLSRFCKFTFGLQTLSRCCLPTSF